MAKIIVDTKNAEAEDPTFDLSPELALFPTPQGYGWIITDRNNAEYEILITHSPGQGGSTVWAVIVTEIDMGLKVETGKSKWTKAGDDITAALTKATSHWLEPINAKAANDA